MRQTQYVKDCLAAASNVRRQVARANEDGDTQSLIRLLGDLIGILVCLEIEAQKLIADEEYIKQNKAA